MHAWEVEGIGWLQISAHWVFNTGGPDYDISKLLWGNWSDIDKEQIQYKLLGFTGMAKVDYIY